MTDLARNLIALEGLDRTGKSTLCERLRGLDQPEWVSRLITLAELRSPFSQEIRKSLSEASPLQKTLLFAADRAWTYERECLPALQAGKLVLWDRYVDSALAYRSAELSAGSLIDLEYVRHVNRPFMSAGLTIYIDVPAATSVQRSTDSRDLEAVYSGTVLERVREYYLERSASEDYVVIDGQNDQETVLALLVEKINAYLC